jgi:hypothetical protein
MILQIHTEKELIDMVGALKKEIGILRDQNNSYLKKLDLMQLPVDKKPIVQHVYNGIGEAEVLELIKKHVTMVYVNKLYNKGR